MFPKVAFPVRYQKRTLKAKYTTQRKKEKTSVFSLYDDNHNGSVEYNGDNSAKQYFDASRRTDVGNNYKGIRDKILSKINPETMWNNIVSAFLFNYSSEASSKNYDSYGVDVIVQQAMDDAIIDANNRIGRAIANVGTPILREMNGFPDN